MPRSGKLSEHKKFKFGEHPGDVPKSVKIAMLERSPSSLAARADMDLNTTGRRLSPEPNRAKSYKRDHVKAANRAVRHKKVVVET